MPKGKYSIAARLKSFTYAFNGLRILLREEPNAWIHLSATVCVIIAGIVFRISPIEWVAVVFAIGLVFSFEIINSSVEDLCDFVCLERHDQIKKVKDLAAAAVLVSAIVAAAVGLIVFLPKIVAMIR